LKKVNCWEFNRCGREPGGKKVKELGSCPAPSMSLLDTIHDGAFGGRVCWVIAGTMCGGSVQGSFAQKYSSCEVCGFYLKVRTEEGLKFVQSSRLLAMLRGTSKL